MRAPPGFRLIHLSRGARRAAILCGVYHTIPKEARDDPEGQTWPPTLRRWPVLLARWARGRPFTHAYSDGCPSQSNVKNDSVPGSANGASIAGRCCWASAHRSSSHTVCHRAAKALTVAPCLGTIAPTSITSPCSWRRTVRLWWLGLSALFGSVMILAVSGVVLACTNSSGPCNACYYGVSAAMSNGACGSHSGQSAAPQNIGVYADEYVSGTNSHNSYGGGHVLNTPWEGTDNTSRIGSRLVISTATCLAVILTTLVVTGPIIDLRTDIMRMQ